MATDLWTAAAQARVAAHGDDKIERAFQAFHADHPEVYREFCRLVQRLIDKGFRHYSAKAVIEAVRFHTDVNAGYAERGEFKINNNFTALYARKWQQDHPSQASFFATRRRISVAGKRKDGA